LVNLHLPGVTLTPLPVAPRQIPFHSGASYFELETRHSDLWRQLEQSGGMAMHIAGDFPAWIWRSGPSEADGRRKGHEPTPGRSEGAHTAVRSTEVSQ
jgi:hypothetical protein